MPVYPGAPTTSPSSTTTGSPLPPNTGESHPNGERFRGIVELARFPLFPHSPTTSRRTDRSDGRRARRQRTFRHNHGHPLRSRRRRSGLAWGPASSASQVVVTQQPVVLTRLRAVRRRDMTRRTAPATGTNQVAEVGPSASFGLRAGAARWLRFILGPRGGIGGKRLGPAPDP
jgi:hypothetical protein